jgi:hypothetical protein
MSSFRQISRIKSRTSVPISPRNTVPFTSRTLPVRLKPDDPDGHAVLAERAVGPEGTGACVLEAATFDPQLHVVPVRAADLCNDRIFGFDETTNPSARSIVFASPERRGAGQPLKRSVVEDLAGGALTTTDIGGDSAHLRFVPIIENWMCSGRSESVCSQDYPPVQCPWGVHQR